MKLFGFTAFLFALFFSFSSYSQTCTSPDALISTISDTAVQAYGHKPMVMTLTGAKKLSFINSLLKVGEDNNWDFDKDAKEDFIIADRIDVLIVAESDVNFALLSKDGCVIGMLAISTDSLAVVIDKANGKSV